jgi:chromosome segregation protein
MFLKQIEVENFKSFGKKMTIPMMNGFTAVTGPNGSGKSNISDAILFVLGPRSSKALRAERLTDLIFNGGNSKQPATFTKVSLVFDNTDRMIPFDSDIAKLTRLVKLSESGEGYNSYFYVNDRKSTLAEFDYLLSSARISAEGYNLVQQGDITRIVAMSTLDRRRILDDISGISKFDEEISKADIEKKATEENLDRITIIMAELDKQLKQLEVEKAAAIKFIETRQRLTQARSSMAYKKKDMAEAEIVAAKNQVEAYGREIEALRQRRVDISKLVIDQEGAIAKLEAEIAAKGGQEFKELKERSDAAKIELARATDLISRSNDDIAEIRQSLAEKVEERKSVTAQIAAIGTRLKELEVQIDRRRTDLALKNASLSEISKKITASDSEVGALQKQVAELENSVKDKEEKGHALVLEKERLEERAKRLASEMTALGEIKGHLEFEVKDLDWRIRELSKTDKNTSGELKALQEAYFSKRNLESKLSKESNELEQSIRSITREYSLLKAELEAAESTAKGYNRAVRAILEARDKHEIRGIQGTIAELATVDPKYEVALNVAAGARMQSIIVDGDEVAATCIQFLKRNNLGRATFLPLTKMLDGNPRGKALLAEKQAVGFAIDLIRYDPKYRPAFWYVFGDTVVVDGLDQARKLMGGVRLVTGSGELIEASGAMVGGTVEVNQLKFGQSAKGKLELLAEQMSKAMDHSASLDAQIKLLRPEIAELEGKIRELNGSGSSNTIKIEGMENNLKEARTKLAKGKDDLEAMAKERSVTDASLTKLAVEFEAVQRSTGEERMKREAARKRLMEIAPKELTDKLRILQAELLTISTELSKITSERDTGSTEVSLYRKRLGELDDFDQEMMEKEVSIKAAAEGAKVKEAKLRIDLAAMKKIEESMGSEMNSLRSKKDQAFKEKTRLESERDSVQTKVETTGDFIVQLKTKQAATEASLKDLEAEIHQHNLPARRPLPSMDEIKSEITRCETTMSAMGNVNLKSIEDYEQKNARHIELKSEVKRLEDQRNELIRLTNDLNEKKKVGLLKVYEGVNLNFKEVYAELSQGGAAELILENPEHPFEGGLIMKAKPRNGKVLRLEALSGGEKSLTALAFIFALQVWQPSPFYLLDEVDMFLDAVNADMVAQRVKKSSKTAQFVQISLRKVTLNKADHIIGVTKPEGGISNVIMRPNLGDIREVAEEIKISDEKIKVLGDGS